MIDSSGYVKQPCIRLEPNGAEPAEVYYRKYDAVYQLIADRLNGGKSIGSTIRDRSGLYLLFAEVEDGVVTFNGYNDSARVRPFSILERIADDAGFVVKVEVAQSFMEEKYRYKPKPEDLRDYNTDHLKKSDRHTPKGPAVPLTPMVKPVVVKPGRRTMDTLEMPENPNGDVPGVIGYRSINHPTSLDTLIAARSGPTPPESLSSQALLN